MTVIKVDLAIRPSTHVVDTVFEHQFLSYSILVKRTIDNYTALNRKRGILPCPDGTCTIHVFLETPLQVVGGADIILSVFQLEHIQSLYRRVHADSQGIREKMIDIGENKVFSNLSQFECFEVTWPA